MNDGTPGTVKGATMTKADIEAMDARVRKAVADAARFAVESPAPKAESALEHVFA